MHPYTSISFLFGWIADRLIGDPPFLHPIIGFGKWISQGEKHLNQGSNKKLKGALFFSFSVLLLYVVVKYLLIYTATLPLNIRDLLIVIGVFFCLSGKTLEKEVKAVFIALHNGLDSGRKQVGRIVGRDTSSLTENEIKTAALETLSENLSDGVIAPMFWFLLLGLPGMFCYKLINTFDSMVGYKNERYLEFGCIPAQIDDVVNYIPARITAFFMLLVSGKMEYLRDVVQESKNHTSPNAGYPEAALAYILKCQFGGAHTYFGEIVEKPHIGKNKREITDEDLHAAIKINQRVELIMGFLVMLWIHFFIN